MRKKDKAKKELIIQFANQFFDTNGIKPLFVKLRTAQELQFQQFIVI